MSALNFYRAVHRPGVEIPASRAEQALESERAERVSPQRPAESP
jgi:hypothetical protein